MTMKEAVEAVATLFFDMANRGDYKMLEALSMICEKAIESESAGTEQL